MCLASLKAAGTVIGDVILSSDEVQGLMREYLYSTERPRGKTKLSGWLHENRESVGMKYASELKRHYI